MDQDKKSASSRDSEKGVITEEVVDGNAKLGRVQDSKESNLLTRVGLNIESFKPSEC